MAREVPGTADKITAVCTGHDYSAPGKPKLDGDDPAAKDALVSALVNDANALVAALKGQGLAGPAASAVALLALVAGQDVEPVEGSDGRHGQWRIALRVAEDRVFSTVDPQARHTRKSPEARWDGYRANVAADAQTGIITDEKLTGAAGAENSDAAVAAEFVSAEPAAGTRRPACLVRRFGLRHRDLRRDRSGRAAGGDQALAAAARRRSRLHHGDFTWMRPPAP